MLGASCFLGGLKHPVQECFQVAARMHAGLLFLATIALSIPSAVAERRHRDGAAFTQKSERGPWRCS